MIYELLLFATDPDSDGGLTGTKIVQTEEECTALGKKLSDEANSHGLSAEFRCEQRPDYFLRGDHHDPDVANNEQAHVVRAHGATAGEKSAIIAAIRTKMIDPASLRVSNITVYPPLNGKKGGVRHHQREEPLRWLYGKSKHHSLS